MPPALCEKLHHVTNPSELLPLFPDSAEIRDGVLWIGGCSTAELAEKYGTPLYVYSQATLLHHLKQIQTAFAPAAPIICYSVKTNANLSICKLMADHGSGFDVTSGGELYRALKAGAKGSKPVTVEAGKTAEATVSLLR